MVSATMSEMSATWLTMLDTIRSALRVSWP